MKNHRSTSIKVRIGRQRTTVAEVHPSLQSSKSPTTTITACWVFSLLPMPWYHRSLWRAVAPEFFESNPAHVAVKFAVHIVIFPTLSLEGFKIANIANIWAISAPAAYSIQQEIIFGQPAVNIQLWHSESGEVLEHHHHHHQHQQQQQQQQHATTTTTTTTAAATTTMTTRLPSGHQGASFADRLASIVLFALHSAQTEMCHRLVWHRNILKLRCALYAISVYVRYVMWCSLCGPGLALQLNKEIGSLHWVQPTNIPQTPLLDNTSHTTVVTTCPNARLPCLGFTLEVTNLSKHKGSQQP